MNRDYDIFEKLLGGDVVWRAFCPGLTRKTAKPGEELKERVFRNTPTHQGNRREREQV